MVSKHLCLCGFWEYGNHEIRKGCLKDLPSAIEVAVIGGRRGVVVLIFKIMHDPTWGPMGLSNYL